MKEVMDEYGEAIIYCVVAGIIIGFFLTVLSAATIC